jgi:hypothetical protein
MAGWQLGDDSTDSAVTVDIESVNLLNLLHKLAQRLLRQ